MASFFQHRLRYFALKARDSISTHIESYEGGKISTKELFSRLWRDVYEQRVTMLKSYEGAAMEPTVYSEEKLLVRKIPFPSTRSLFVGDVVFFKDPIDSKAERVSRIAAMEGEEMVSRNESDVPFELERGACWVVCDNDSLKPKDCTDSRTFGPLSLGNILGRVLYAFRSSTEHGKVKNSEEAMEQDSPVLAVELDLDELSDADKK